VILLIISLPRHFSNWSRVAKTAIRSFDEDAMDRIALGLLTCVRGRSTLSVLAYEACGTFGGWVGIGSPKDFTTFWDPLFLSPFRSLVGGGTFQREWVASFAGIRTIHLLMVGPAEKRRIPLGVKDLLILRFAPPSPTSKTTRPTLSIA